MEKIIQAKQESFFEAKNPHENLAIFMRASRCDRLDQLKTAHMPERRICCGL